MTPSQRELLQRVTDTALVPALKLLPSMCDTPSARVQLLAQGLQESGLVHRYQLVEGGKKGPARGLEQFERAGGVHGVMTHPVSAGLAKQLCIARRVPSLVESVVWEELEHDDVLALGLARLLLLTDPRPLPKLGDEQGAWDYYLRVWKPGKPRPAHWPENYRLALAFVTGAAA